jgi:hypothetical protein
MPTNFQLFKQQIDDAVDLIESSQGLSSAIFLSKNIVEPSPVENLIDTQSLLSRCDNLCRKFEDKKPIIRIIHHLACSGGTLISKSISSMPNVYLLSELHPFTNLGHGKGSLDFTPSDIPSLTKHANIPQQKELASQLFKSGIDEVYQHVTRYGGTLVLREHTHSDYNTNEPIPEKSTLIALLEDKYEVKSILTVRNPIDSYTSLIKNNWLHFEPKSFDEYCRRLLYLTEQFQEDRIFKYESFIKDPQQEMKAITKALDLPFDNTFEDVFSLFKVTGDSGRTSDVISPRERAVPDSVLRESELSEYYKELILTGAYK